MSAVPYVVGQWVCGPRFYGRRAEIEALLGAAGRRLWVAGLRRMGKTSLLRQLEVLATGDGQARLPLFWDLQGVGSAGELARGFADALLDAEELLARHGISLREVEDGDLPASLERLERALGRRGVELLLLCDEADELIGLEPDAVEAVRAVWAKLARPSGGRLVLASSLRLCDLAAGGHAVASLLDGFAPPLWLGVLSDDEARTLVLQLQLPAEARPSLEPAAVEAIRERCGNHPMLLQLVAKRHHERGDLAEALRQVAADRTLDHMFAADFEILSPAEREILVSASRAAGGDGPLPARPAACGEAPALRRLLRLGLLRRTAEGRLEVPNRFLASWLRGSKQTP